ncbi:MAG TPA: magnesium and cobalt transport protein CorA [Cytophagales bacterium]|nr:magnesium and cobalt transport protein CorA [Cytophagales bacterium]
MAKRGRRKLVHEPLPPPSQNRVILELIQYNEKEYAKHADLHVQEMLTYFKPNWVNWINVDGLHDHTIINKLGDHFSLHGLLLEDIIQEHQPKAEEYEDYLFFTLKMLYKIDNGRIDYEQISFVLGRDYLLCFQEKEGDLFDGFRERIRLDQGRVRRRKSDYLLYRLVDIIVDNYYAVLDALGQQIEEVEDDVYENPTIEEFRKIQKIKKELIFLRKSLYPLRDALSKIIKNDSGFIEPQTIRYFADVYDHVIHLIDSLDTYKDLSSGLMDIHINNLNTRTNEVMKLLTIISVIFIPLTFIVGVYGMNFDYLPELHFQWSYPILWIIMVGVALAMVGYFKFKKWF